MQAVTHRGYLQSSRSAQGAMRPGASPAARARLHSKARVQHQQQLSRHSMPSAQGSDDSAGGNGPGSEVTNRQIMDILVKAVLPKMTGMETRMDGLDKEIKDLKSMQGTFMGSVIENIIRETLNRVKGPGYNMPLLLLTLESVVQLLHNVLSSTDRGLLRRNLIQMALKDANLKRTLRLVLEQVALAIEGPSMAIELATSLAAAREVVTASDSEPMVEKLDDLTTKLFIRDKSMTAADSQKFMDTSLGRMLFGLTKLVAAMASGTDKAVEFLDVHSIQNPCTLLLSTAALATNGSGEELGQAIIELDMAGSARYDAVSKTVVVEAAEIKAGSGGVQQVVLRARVLGGLLALVGDSESRPWGQQLRGVVYKPRAAKSATQTPPMKMEDFPFLVEETTVVSCVEVLTVLV